MFHAVLLSFILLSFMIGIQQQNHLLILTSITYLIIITWMQQWNLNDTMYVYSFIIFLIILSSYMLVKQYPKMEGFGIPSRPCTMYFTTDKTGCDQGYYALSDTDFQRIFVQQATIVAQTPLTSKNYNTEKQKYDLLTIIAKNRRKLKNNKDANGICKQEFPGWLEDPDQPEKIPYDTIKNRGALRDWAFCYRNALPINTPNSLYNPNNVATNYNKLISQFGEHTIASADNTPFKQSSKNITGVTVYSKADPEYARIYFKDWKVDPDASCKNSAVDSVQSLSTLTPITTRYGIEVGLTEDQKKITTLSTIRPSPGNNNQLLYVGDYNDPDLDILEKIFFEYIVIQNQGLVLRPKIAIDTYLYRFYIDMCDRLMVPPTLPFNLKTTEKISWNMSTITEGYNSVLLTTREYPFGTVLPPEIVNTPLIRAYLSKLKREPTSTPSYNKIYTIEQLRSQLQNQINELETYLTTVDDPTYNSNEALKVGLVTDKYILPPNYDKYLIRNMLEFDFDNNLNMPIYLQNRSVTLSTKDGLSISMIPSKTESTYIEYTGQLNIDMPGKYEFKLAFGSTNVAHYPVNSTIVVEINQSIVASYFACKNYDECYSIFNVKCKKENECPIPLITDLQNKTGPLIDRSMAVNNPQKIHNPVQIDITTQQNDLRIRIYLPKGASPTPNMVYVLYRKVGDVVVVKNQSIDNFRILGREGSIWKGYPKDTIQYRPYDIRPSLLNSMYATKQILLNRNALKQIEIRRINTLKGFVQRIRKDPIKMIEASKQLISQNNRIYAFFTQPTLIPTTEASDPIKIQKFNDNFTGLSN